MTRSNSELPRARRSRASRGGRAASLLRSAWDESRWALGIGSDEGAFASLVARYAEPHRRYHDGSHVEACLHVLDTCRGEASRLGEVTSAILFHDAVYDPHRSDSEARSASLAREVLASASPEAVARIEAMILATATHQVPADASSELRADVQLVLDVDLAILGASEVDYDAFEDAIVAEYDFVPVDVFRAVRRSLLVSFLGRSPIYGSSTLRARFEQCARENLQRRILQLA